MNKLYTAVLVLVLVGGGCSYKYESDWKTSATTSENTNENWPKPGDPDFSCVKEGENPAGDVACCPGLEPVAVDDSYSVCGKPGTGHKPRMCAAPNEVITAETPNCCAGLEPTEKNNKWVCDYQK